MSKEADLIQIYNDKKREFEYFVKGFNITKSIKILLKAHKEEYDTERRVFAECKGYCDAEKEFKDKISDLEAKLAESENEIKTLICDYESRITKNHELMSWLEHKNEELKQQLAEKEKEIAELKQRLKDTIKIYSDDFVEKDKELKELRFQARNIFPLVENLEDKVNQDKISFAVEQFEKLKEKVICGVMDISNDFWDYFVRDGSSYMTSENLYDALEQEFAFQIQELKKEME